MNASLEILTAIRDLNDFPTTRVGNYNTLRCYEHDVGVLEIADATNDIVLEGKTGPRARELLSFHGLPSDAVPDIIRPFWVYNHRGKKVRQDTLMIEVGTCLGNPELEYRKKKNRCEEWKVLIFTIEPKPRLYGDWDMLKIPMNVKQSIRDSAIRCYNCLEFFSPDDMIILSQGDQPPPLPPSPFAQKVFETYPEPYEVPHVHMELEEIEFRNFKSMTVMRNEQYHTILPIQVKGVFCKRWEEILGIKVGKLINQGLHGAGRFCSPWGVVPKEGHHKIGTKETLTAFNHAVNSVSTKDWVEKTNDFLKSEVPNPKEVYGFEYKQKFCEPGKVKSHKPGWTGSSDGIELLVDYFMQDSYLKIERDYTMLNEQKQATKTPEQLIAESLDYEFTNMNCGQFVEAVRSAFTTVLSCVDITRDNEDEFVKDQLRKKRDGKNTRIVPVKTPEGTSKDEGKGVNLWGLYLVGDSHFTCQDGSSNIPLIQCMFTNGEIPTGAPRFDMYECEFRGKPAIMLIRVVDMQVSKYSSMLVSDGLKVNAAAYAWSYFNDKHEGAEKFNYEDFPEDLARLHYVLTCIYFCLTDLPSQQMGLLCSNYMKAMKNKMLGNEVKVRSMKKLEEKVHECYYGDLAPFQMRLTNKMWLHEFPDDPEVDVQFRWWEVPEMCRRMEELSLTAIRSVNT